MPADKAAHGHVCFGRHSDCEDGMNDQGLFVAVAAAPSSGRFVSTHRSICSPVVLDQLLAHCASVEEAINWLKKSPNVRINNWEAGFLGLRINSGVGGHFLVADKSGNSAVCEWIKGKLKVVRKKGRCQLMTNFLLSNPDMGNYPCPRFATLSKYFEEAGSPTVEGSTKALQLAHSSLTRYSQVYDLVNGEVYVFYGHRFVNPLKINLAAELAKGPRELNLKEMFGVQPEPAAAPETEGVTLPKVVQTSALSAEEVLRKGLEARGGMEALRNIRSIHAKGNIDLGYGWVDAAPIEIFAMRPDKWRLVADLKSSVGLDSARIDIGFDGRRGWDDEPGAAPKKLTGRLLKQQKEIGQFFAWQDDPAFYNSMQCLGQASFDGKTCYALKMVLKSGHQETHYYDTNNFLLAGVIWTVGTEDGPVLERDSYGAYREFGGFKFPTRQCWRNKWSGGVMQ